MSLKIMLKFGLVFVAYGTSHPETGVQVDLLLVNFNEDSGFGWNTIWELRGC